MNSKRKAIFLTGVTGTLGKEILKELLLQTGVRLFVLVRRKARQSQWERVRRILEAVGLQKYLGTRVQVLEGDVTLPNLGLRHEDMKILRSEVREFYHIAALTSLNGSEADCRKINIGGTVNALAVAWDFFAQGALERFYYFSTAYVSGSRQTYFAREDGLPEAPAHANFYESSKYEAEQKVRAAIKGGLPAVIFRPSIVVGDSRTGEVSEFNVIYPFIRLFAHGMLSVLPTRPENTFNIVPIDFVVKASLAIAAQKSSVGKTFHLVSKEPPSIGMLLQVKSEEYPDMPAVEVMDPDDFKAGALDPVTQMVFQMLEPYLGYLNGHLEFDTANTARALRDTAIEFPKTDYAFLKTLLRYAVDSGYIVLQRA